MMYPLNFLTVTSGGFVHELFLYTKIVKSLLKDENKKFLG